MGILLSRSASTVEKSDILPESAIRRAGHLNAIAAIKRAIRPETALKEIVKGRWSVINVMS